MSEPMFSPEYLAAMTILREVGHPDPAGLVDQWIRARVPAADWPAFACRDGWHHLTGGYAVADAQSARVVADLLLAARPAPPPTVLPGERALCDRPGCGRTGAIRPDGWALCPTHAAELDEEQAA